MKVIDKRKITNKTTVHMGDVVRVDRDYYRVSKHSEGLTLINMDDGNLWSHDIYREDIKVDDLINDIKLNNRFIEEVEVIPYKKIELQLTIKD